MKKTLYNILISFFACTILLFSACNLEQVAPDTPDCIILKIDELKEIPVIDKPIAVYEYYYKNLVVYYIPAYFDGMMSELYDEQCNLLCYPDGGDDLCSDFHEEAAFIRLIWEK